MAEMLEAYLKRTNSIVRFLLVGILNTLTGLSIMFFLLNGAGASYWISTFAGNTAGATVSYFLNRNFTFQSEVNMQRGLPRFIAVIIISYFSSYSLSRELAFWASGIVGFEIISADELAMLLGTCLYTAANYLGQKYFVFR